MKTLISALFVALLGAASVPAQTSPTVPAPPDVLVLQKDWRLDIRNPALDADPFSANTEFTENVREQRVNDIKNTIRAKGSESREPPPPRPTKTSDPAPKPSATYIYRAKIKNTGAKTIRVVEWGYTFVNPDTRQELGRHRYASKVKIRPGQNNELIGRSATPQTYVVNAKNAGAELGEQIVIYRIEYEDGSVWENPKK